MNTRERLLEAIRGNPRGSYREWSKAAGISSTSVVGHYLGVLAAEGKVRLTPGKARSVVLLPEEASSHEPAPNGLPDRAGLCSDGDPAIEAELRFYRDLFSACCGLVDSRRTLDAAAADDEEAWDAFEDALDEVEEYVRTMRHADAMDAAGVTCNELHHMNTVLSA